MNVYYSMGFTFEEKTELLAMVASSPKWAKRINEAFGHPITCPTPLHPQEYLCPPLKPTGERIQVDAWGNGYVLIDTARFRPV